MTTLQSNQHYTHHERKINKTLKSFFMFLDKAWTKLMRKVYFLPLVSRACYAAQSSVRQDRKGDLTKEKK